MAEEITKKLIEYLDGTKDFLLEQSPQVFQEMLKYKFMSAVLTSILCFVLIAVGIGVFYFSFTSGDRDKYGSREYWQFIGMAIPAFISFMLFIQLCCNIDEIICIKTAPKYYILQQIRKGK